MRTDVKYLSVYNHGPAGYKNWLVIAGFALSLGGVNVFVKKKNGNVIKREVGNIVHHNVRLA